jgi:prepilin-type N-terminal cleavage/methylation domain-containing protein
MPKRGPANFIDRRGFTLLELLLATALLTVLMVGILAVVADFGASKRAFKSLHQELDGTQASAAGLDDQTIASWLRLLQDDLGYALAIDAKRENELVLVGYGALNEGSGERSHRPVRVTYLLEEMNGRSCLIRRQELLDVPTNQNVRRDLVCCGVLRFILKHLTTVRAISPGNPQAPGGTQPAAAPADGNRGRGSQWNLQVWAQGQDAPMLERILYLPAGGSP